MFSRVLLVLVHLFTLALQDCVYYGECHVTETGKRLNCLSPGKKPDKFQDPSTSLEILREICPLFLEKVPEEKFCCNDEQIPTMKQGVDYAAGMFKRCPTCTANLNLHVCYLNCSPNQTDFVRVVGTGEHGNLKDEPYVTAIDVHISREYKESTFDSCKEVTAPATGEKVMNLACGVWGADQCTPERWFEFFGDVDANLVCPFEINYNPAPNASFRPLQLETLPCNESYESQRSCSCSDCEASCTIPFQHSGPPDQSVPVIVGGVVAALAFVGLNGSAAWFLFRRRGNSDEGVPERRGSGLLEAAGRRPKAMLADFFTKWGAGCARNPVLVFAVASWVVAGLAYGVTNLDITTDPTEIWASPTCKSRLDKDYFDSRFAPFYRTNQVFIKSKGLDAFRWTSSSNLSFTFGPAFNRDFLAEVLKLQMQIQELGTDRGRGLEKICLAPMKNEFFSEDSVKYCAVQSVWGYLQNDAGVLDDTDALYDRLQKCLRNNFDPSCLAPYGGPIFSPLAVGGAPEGDAGDPLQNRHLLATGVTLTFIVNNALDKGDLEPALEWEKTFIDFLKGWDRNERPEFMEIGYSAERSIQDELERESQAELTTVVVSYFVMFVYVTLSLGRVRGLASLLTDSKFTLGLGGIVIVLASVLASMGVFGYLGVSTTLLTIEVIPFLVLAVGVDNIFILVHAFQHLQETSEGSVADTVGLALGKVGPSILLTTTSEAACFFIGTLSDMPAIKTFAEYSSLALVLNFLLQITCFVSLLSLDASRQKNNYADVFCCVKLKKRQPGERGPNILVMLFRDHYGPFLVRPRVRAAVIVAFVTWFCVSIACLPHVEVGLDQELSMPEDSHVVTYFQFMKDLLSLGPPVYFVVKNGLNYTDPREVDAVCGTVRCDSDSLVTYLTRASRLADVSYIAKSPSSWIDDYFDWLSNPKCCKQFPGNGSFCPHQNPDCVSCEVTVEDWRPRAADFKKFLPYFLNDNPDMECPKGGHAAYAEGVNFELDEAGQLQVRDNYFMAYHTPLKTSRDFYMALENARDIADHLSTVLSSKLGRSAEVFPYSIFYVYYEQYLTVLWDAVLSLGLSLLAVFLVTFLYTGFHLRSSLLVLVGVTSILVDMTAMLFWWNITLNAISLVNLIVAAGIGVEFCSHVVHAFASSSEPDKPSRALFAIGTVGSSVFSGIALTKFLGIVVLAFAQTLMLRTFYFKMYLGMVVMGTAHGLVLMPVLLSYFG